MQLKQCSLPGGACVSAIEIVPYEHLWSKTIDILSSTHIRKPDQLQTRVVSVD